jgi:hypothetical protein
MDTITILRELWSRRRVVAIVMLVAAFVAVSVVYQLPSLKSRRYTVGVATTQILVDTPTSQVADVAPRGADSLGLRANLLASLMVDGAVKNDIAQQAGLRPGQLSGTTTASSTSAVVGGASSSAPQPSGPGVHLLNTNILSDPTGQQLPIIQVEVQAPDLAGAARLANAAITGLRTYLDSTAAQENIPDSSRLHVDALGVPQPALADRGPSILLALLAFVGVLVIGCGALLAGPRLARRWRMAGERAGSGPGEETIAGPGEETIAGLGEEIAGPGEETIPGTGGASAGPARGVPNRMTNVVRAASARAVDEIAEVPPVPSAAAAAPATKAPAAPIEADLRWPNGASSSGALAPSDIEAVDYGLWKSVADALVTVGDDADASSPELSAPAAHPSPKRQRSRRGRFS